MVPTALNMIFFILLYTCACLCGKFAKKSLLSDVFSNFFSCHLESLHTMLVKRCTLTIPVVLKLGSIKPLGFNGAISGV